jgi:hypothetical protein
MAWAHWLAVFRRVARAIESASMTDHEVATRFRAGDATVDPEDAGIVRPTASGDGRRKPALRRVPNEGGRTTGTDP